MEGFGAVVLIALFIFAMFKINKKLNTNKQIDGTHKNKKPNQKKVKDDELSPDTVNMLKELVEDFKTEDNASKTDSKTNVGTTIIVKKKTPDDKEWHYFNKIHVESDSEYIALLDAAFQITGSDNPRINQADVPMSATVVMRKEKISYRFEIDKPAEPIPDKKTQKVKLESQNSLLKDIKNSEGWELVRRKTDRWYQLGFGDRDLFPGYGKLFNREFDTWYCDVGSKEKKDFQTFKDTYPEHREPRHSELIVGKKIDFTPLQNSKEYEILFSGLDKENRRRWYFGLVKKTPTGIKTDRAEDSY